MIITNNSFKIVLNSLYKRMYENNNLKNVASSFQKEEATFFNEKSQLKKKHRITEKYFKIWIKSMTNIYDNLCTDVNESLNIYENKNISIQDMFHLFLIQLKFESKRVLNINFNLIFDTNIKIFDFISKKKYISNKKLIKELIPVISDDYMNINNGFIKTMNCEIYIDKINKNIYKIFDMYSLLEMIQESFIQKILYSYLPHNIAEVHGIYKTTGKNENYILCQTYFEGNTLDDNYLQLNKKQLLNILISVCNKLILLQKNVSFLHNDLKLNNVCINIQNEEAYFIDFGYSSLICNNQLVYGYFELHLDTFSKNKSLENYIKDKVMTHQIIINDKYRNSSDLFYLIYSILYYNNNQLNPIYDILYNLFIVKDSLKGNINLFDIIYLLENNSFEHAGFFMTKSNELFNQLFENNIENIELFYEKFLPENLSVYLSTFIE